MTDEQGNGRAPLRAAGNEPRQWETSGDFNTV